MSKIAKQDHQSYRGIRYFVPPIILDNARKLLKRREYEVDHKFETCLFNRVSLINRAINRYNPNHVKYLEIGLGLGDTFDSIPLPLDQKFGVDPYPPSKGCTFPISSDLFFERNNRKFDVVFIDGLHEYPQVLRDTSNALNCLNEDGVLLIHDMLPQNEIQQLVPRKSSTWTGDVWKLIGNLNVSKNIEFAIANFDHGVGIVKPKKDWQFNFDPNTSKELNYSDFINLKSTVRILSSKDAFTFLEI